MIESILSALTIFVFSFFAWLLTLTALYLLRDLPRVWFVISHYVLNIVIFSAIFGTYFRYLNHFSPFTTMAAAMISLFLVELIYWRFFYKGELWFLNFWDWIVPAFLLASTIYLAGEFLK